MTFGKSKFTSVPVHNIIWHNSYIYKTTPTPQDRDILNVPYIHALAESWEMRKIADNTVETILSLFVPKTLTML